MKIAIVRKKYNPFGGAERYLHLLSSHLIKEGHEIHIFTSQWVEDDRSGVIFHHVPMIGGLSLLKIWSFAIACWWMLRHFSGNVVISNERIFFQDIFRASDGVHLSWLKIRMRYLSWIRKISILINPLHWTIRFFDWYIFTRHAYKKIIAPSEFIKRDIIQNYGVHERDIHVIYNGVDLQRFHPDNKGRYRIPVRNGLGFSNDEPVLLFVGTGFERKGLRYVIGALTHLPSEIKLIVIGKGRFKIYRKMAESYKVLERIRFLGPLRDVEKYYAASDILILPTLYEPMANVILEALATGIPVVTSRHCGNMEVVTEGVDGFLIDNPFDSREIAENIKMIAKLIEIPEIQQKTRKKAEQFTFERAMGEIMHTLKETAPSCLK